MKNELRIKCTDIRKKLELKTISEKIIKRLFVLEEYKKAKNILCYYPLKYEIDTKICLSDNSKNWFLPKVNDLNLDICPYENLCLKTGSYNIKEPETKKINNLEILDLIIIPAIAADRSGFRIGYGKGYYDRFLTNIKYDVTKIILIPSCLLFDTIFPEKHDKKSNIIITDKEILRI